MSDSTEFFGWKPGERTAHERQKRRILQWCGVISAAIWLLILCTH